MDLYRAWWLGVVLGVIIGVIGIATDKFPLEATAVLMIVVSGGRYVLLRR